ncbi:expansin EXLX1 family cellulose-binding protein [Nocardia sp. NPDC050712]|uniref:expansin EXLX1 family cellulose-binding protein n=1 Tax=Nocardia sp. NPDC050712 TaxID=3155518 RepID=UPI0033EF9D41
MLGALLAVVGVVVWVARPEPVACGAARTATDTMATTQVAFPPSSSGVATKRTTTPPPTAAPSAAVPGEARYYSFTPSVACSYPDLPLDGFYAGISTHEYGTADLCGAFLDVHGPNGDVRVLIADRCPGCSPGQLDLSTAAFERIADPTHGVADIRYSVVRDPDPAPEMIYEVKPDSSASWLAILFSNTGNPLHQVAIRASDADDWRPLTRGPDNHWTISGAGEGPFAVRVTDLYDQTTEIYGLTLDPGPHQTGARLYTNEPPPVEPAQPIVTPAAPTLPPPTPAQANTGQALAECRAR